MQLISLNDFINRTQYKTYTPVAVEESDDPAHSLFSAKNTSSNETHARSCVIHVHLR